MAVAVAAASGAPAGAALFSADAICCRVLQACEYELGQELGALGVEHRRLHVEVVVALLAGGQHHVPAHEGLRLDDLEEPRSRVTCVDGHRLRSAHGCHLRKLARSFKPNVWLFSG